MRGAARHSVRLSALRAGGVLVMIRDRVRDLKKKGMTLDQVRAARPTLDFDGRYGSTTGPWTTDMFVEAVYRSLRKP